MTRHLYIKSHAGLGDQVYMRPFVLWLASRPGFIVSLATSWPELYWDHPEVRLVPVDRGLRTQADNLKRTKYDLWSPEPTGLDVELLNLTYAPGFKEKQDVYKTLLKQTCRFSPAGYDDLDTTFDVPPVYVEDPRPEDCPKPLALFHPPSRRAEWDCPSRNPDPNIWDPILRRVRRTHHVHWVGFLAKGKEWSDYTPRNPSEAKHDTFAMNGELSWIQIASLMRRADVCISPVGNWLPLGLAVGARIFMPFGGHVPPEILVHRRMIQYEGQWHAVAPDPFCFCVLNLHQCKKAIPYLKVMGTLERALRPLKRTTAA